MLAGEADFPGAIVEQHEVVPRAVHFRKFQKHEGKVLLRVGLGTSMANINRPEDRMRIAIRHHLQALGRDRALAIVWQVELRHSLKFMTLLSHQEVADYLNILRKIVEQGQNEGIFRRTLHPQLVAKSVFGILDEMVTSWVLSDKEYALADQAGPVADLVLNGLL